MVIFDDQKLDNLSCIFRAGKMPTPQNLDKIEIGKINLF
ncbi:MAG: hypothetical protein RLZZ507_2200 [Cyanobacteriota bacterium]|jgi:dsDNA-binding SOS-regulon protein